MTKGELISALQGPLGTQECPVIIKTESDYLWANKVKYEPNLGREGLGAIVIEVS